jgi:SlyX protein
MTEVDRRLAELETRVAFQDDALETLNREIVALRAALESLRRDVEDAKRKLGELQPGAVGAREDESPPPHY